MQIDGAQREMMRVLIGRIGFEPYFRGKIKILHGPKFKFQCVPYIVKGSIVLVKQIYSLSFIDHSELSSTNVGSDFVNYTGKAER